MRKLFFIAFLLICFAATSMAQGQPSSKATADVNTLVKCHMTVAPDGTVVPEAGSCVDLFKGGEAVATQGQWIEIMNKKVKLSNSQSLFVSPSLVTGLYTQTKTVTKPQSTTSTGTSTAEAMGGVYLRAVLVPDAAPEKEIEAAPLTSCAAGILGCVTPAGGKWGIMLDSRIQTLTQELSACLVNVDTVVNGVSYSGTGTCDFTSTIGLTLNTTSAHTFNFVFANPSQGTYSLKIYAAVASSASYVGESGGLAIGAAAFGIGSMTAESVRLVHDFEF